MPTSFAIFDVSTPDLILILAIILVLFGGRKIPELTRTIGESFREFRDAVAADVKSPTDEASSEDVNTAEDAHSEQS